MRLGAYPRVSRQGAREDERFRSPQFQLELMNGAGAREGFDVVPYPAEIDVSGSKPRRKILDRIIADVEAGELDGILVAKLDRLGRLRPVDRLELLQRIEDAGGVVRSASEQLDETTPEGRFARDVFLGVARMQWEKYAEQFEMAKSNASDKSIAIKSVRPFGLRFTETHGLEVDEGEAAIVLELFERRAEGWSLNRLAALFHERTGREVPSSTINYMLKNRVYLGELRYGRGADVLVNREPGFAAIVPLDLFDAVQRTNEARSSGRGVAVNKARSLLAGLARCRNCGRGLVSSQTGSGRRRSYKCPATARLCSARAHILEDELDAYVLEKVLEWAGPAADELVEVEVEHGSDAERLVAETRLRQAEESLVEYERDVELELELGREAYKAGRAARVELVERRRRDLEELGEASELEVARTTLRRELAGAGGELDVAERRRLLGVVLEAVVVTRTPRRGAPASERAELVWKAPATLGEDGAELVEEVV